MAHPVFVRGAVAPLQERFLTAGDARHHQEVAVLVEGQIRAEPLRAALSTLTRRHDALRTTFERGPQGWEAVVAAARPPVLRVRDGDVLPRDLPGELAAEVSAPFDLARGPLLRLLLVRLTTGQHVISLVLPGAVADPASLRLMLVELATGYGNAGSDGTTQPDRADPGRPGMPPWTADRQPTAGVEPWRAELAGIPSEPVLPPARVHPEHPVGPVAALDVPVGADVLDGLLEHAGRDATVAGAALVGMFLARLSGRDDVVLGVHTDRRGAGRELPIGRLDDLLALRLQLPPGCSYRDVVTATSHRLATGLRLPPVPVDRLERELGLPGVLTRVQFGVVDEPVVCIGGNDVVVLQTDPVVGDADLTLTLVRGRHGPRLRLRHRTDLLDPGTARQWAACLAQLATVTSGAPERPLASVPLLPPAARAAMLSWGNTTAPPSQPNSPVQELVRRRAVTHPDRTAVTTGVHRLTYAQLDHRADELAGRLVRSGIGLESVVALCLERSPEFAVAVLAVLKAGGAYLPIDPATPPERVAFLLEDSAAALLVTRPQERLRLPPTGELPVVLLDGPTIEELPGPAAAVENPADADLDMDAAGPAPAMHGAGTLRRLAYVIYTSGSTGRPKGVLLEHRGLVNLALAAAGDAQVTSTDRVLQFSSVAFDASVWEMFRTWVAGATLCIAGPDERAGAALLECLRRHRITLATLPPTALATMPWTPGALPLLRTLIVAGEKCPASVSRQWGQGRRFVNAYGPTESTVCATSARIEEGEESVIGRPLSGLRVYVLDPDLDPVPIGVPGELFVAGAGCARGYLARPDTTASHFLPDPFGPLLGAAPGGRMYRTGDVVRYLSDGRLEFLGRRDEQLKIRGHRVEPAEIEAVLSCAPGVRHAVVVGDHGQDPVERLIAYVVPERPGDDVDADARADVARWREWLTRRLPAYLVPSVFLVVDELPLNATGKVDRTRLPDPRGAGRPTGAPSGATGSGATASERPLAAALAALWAEVLQVDPGTVAPDDDFFAMGGHSVAAMRLLALIEARLGLLVQDPELFDSLTLDRLVHAVGRSGAGPGQRSVPTGPAGGPR